MTERILAIIPIRGNDEEFQQGIPQLGGRSLLEYTFRSAQESQRLDRWIVVTDSEAVAEKARALGADVPFIRPPSLSSPTTTLTDVLLYTLEWLQKNQKYRPDWVLKLEVTHPFRPQGIVDRLIETTLASGIDSSFLAHEEEDRFWTLNDEGIPQLLGSGRDTPRTNRAPFYREMSGLGAMTRVGNLQQKEFYGPNVGLIPFRDVFACVDIHKGKAPSFRDREGYRQAELLAAAYNEKNAGTVSK
jgi:CMP-N-acetylneuraminic acid synthetase